jgi:myo-inositol-1(or 4)-monophosphatase
MEIDLLELSKNAVLIALNKLSELDNKNIKNYFFSQEIPRELKADADVIIENILIEKLSLSGLSIVSEENGLTKSKIDSKLRFIVDPIDGTVNFIRGISNCSISVALFKGNMPVFGVIGSYPDGVIAWGGKDIGAFIGETPIKVSSIKNPKKGVLCTGFPSRFEFESKESLDQINLMQTFNKVRMLGSASQSLLKVAQGSVEAYTESRIMIWDVAAGIAIVEGAGGEFRINYKKDYDKPLDVVASNNLIDKSVWNNR